MRANSHSVRGTKCLEEKRSKSRILQRKELEPLHKDLYKENILLKRIFQKARFKR